MVKNREQSKGEEIMRRWCHEALTFLRESDRDSLSRTIDAAISEERERCRRIACREGAYRVADAIAPSSKTVTMNDVQDGDA